MKFLRDLFTLPSDTDTSDTDWLRPWSPRSWIPLDDAATLIAVFEYPTYTDKSLALGERAWRQTLEDAVDSGQIRAGTWSTDRGNQPLSHADIRAWCEAAGATWPVPLPSGSAPTTDDALREALAASRAECEALRDALARLQEEAERLRADNAALRGERTALAVEPLQIKGKTFKKLLGVIGEFPQQYPNAKTAEFKLDNDVRPWIEKTTGLGKREAHVFGTIVAEHFDLKTGRTKTFT